MAEQRRTRPVTPFVKLSLCAASGVVLCGLSGCSSSSEPNPGGNSGAISGSDASASADPALPDGSISCVGDPRGETFALNLTHKGAAGISFVIVGANDNPPAVDDNTWTMKILDPSGQPVKDAVLSFPKGANPSDPWMPDHGHGGPTAKATNNNDGTYTIAPLYFFMGGIWSTYISVQAGSVTDSTTFTFCISS